MNKPLKILVIRNDHIGDLLYSTCVFREIKKYLSDSKVTVIASKLNRPLIEKNNYVDEIIELEMPSKDFSSVSKYYNLSKKLKKRKFDIGIDLRGSQMNAFLLWFSSIKTRIGKTDAYRSKLKQKLISLFFNNPIFTGHFETKEHLAMENLGIINQGLSIKSKNITPEVFFDKEDEKEIDNLLKKSKIKKYICLLPFAGLKEKQWPFENLRKLVKWLDKTNHKILILGTKKDEERIKKLTHRIKNFRIITNMDLRKEAILFKKSSLVIGHDGGPSYIASAIGANLILLIPETINGFPLIKSNPIGEGKIRVLTANKTDMGSITIEKVKGTIKEILKIK